MLVMHYPLAQPPRKSYFRRMRGPSTAFLASDWLEGLSSSLLLHKGRLSASLSPTEVKCGVGLFSTIEWLHSFVVDY